MQNESRVGGKCISIANGSMVQLHWSNIARDAISQFEDAHKIMKPMCRG
jgi:hypothetical protein